VGLIEREFNFGGAGVTGGFTSIVKIIVKMLLGVGAVQSMLQDCHSFTKW
jgi:hypothetical protein